MQWYIGRVPILFKHIIALFIYSNFGISNSENSSFCVSVFTLPLDLWLMGVAFNVGSTTRLQDQLMTPHNLMDLL